MATWSWLAYTVMEALIAVACCLGNALVMVAVCAGVRDSLREPTFCFLVSLAAADFLVGMAAVPLAVVLDGWVRMSPELCLLLSCVVLVLTQASVLSLLAIAIDRYLRLHTPLRYKSAATQQRTCLAVTLCWLLSCLLGLAPLLGWRRHSAPPASTNATSGSTSIPSIPSTSSSSCWPPCTFLSVISLPFMVYFNFLGCVMAPLLVMALLYARVFRSLRRRLRDSSPPAQASLLRERRLARSLALVLLLFAGCWLPLHLMNCLLHFRGAKAVTQGTLYAGRYPAVSRQLGRQPRGLRLPHPEDPAGVPSNLDPPPAAPPLLPRRPTSQPGVGEPAGRAHRDLRPGRLQQRLTGTFEVKRLCRLLKFRPPHPSSSSSLFVPPRPQASSCRGVASSG